MRPRGLAVLTLGACLALPAVAAAQAAGETGSGLDAPEAGEAPDARQTPDDPVAPESPDEAGDPEVAARPGSGEEAAPAPVYAPAGSEVADGLDPPEPGVTRPRRPSPGEPAARPDAEEEPWGGPRVEIGYTHYVVADGFGGGDVHAGFFGGYLDTGVVRLGGSLELGARDYSLAQDDALVRLALVGGYQHLEWAPIVPYAALVGTLGWMIGKRFRTPGSEFLFGGGLEVGIDVNLARSLYVGVGLGYSRVGVDGTGRDLWVLRLRVGL